MSVRRLLAFALFVGLATVGASGVATAWDTYGPNAPSAAVDSSTVDCHGLVTVSGQNWPEQTTITISLDETKFTTATTDENGQYSTAFGLPSTIGMGDHQLDVNGDIFGEPLHASTTFTIDSCNQGGGGGGGNVTTTSPTNSTSPGNDNSNTTTGGTPGNTAAPGQVVVGGIVVTRGSDAAAPVPVVAALAFTGASHTARDVGIAVLLILVGLTMVIALRRRRVAPFDPDA